MIVGSEMLVKISCDCWKRYAVVAAKAAEILLISDIGEQSKIHILLLCIQQLGYRVQLHDPWINC